MIPAPFQSHEWSKQDNAYFANLGLNRKSWFLWPFTVTKTKFDSGSVMLTIEFRVFQKFGINASFFWKHQALTD